MEKLGLLVFQEGAINERFVAVNTIRLCGLGNVVALLSRHGLISSFFVVDSRQSEMRVNVSTFHQSA